MVKQTLNQTSNQKHVKDVSEYIDSLLAQKQSEAEPVDSHYADLVAQTRILLSRGGKRVRPQLVINSYEAFGGAPGEGTIKAAASQELFHAFALIHDDIIDRDLIRWGGPNIGGHYLKRFSKKMNAEDARHHADAWALLAGDLCLNLAFEALADSGFSPSKILKANKMLMDTLFYMVGGEIMDVGTSVLEEPGSQLDEAHFMRLYEAKTAIYSFSTPLRLGALLAGAGIAADRQLKKFGYHIGIAFQIKDDILGIYGDESKTGKSTLSDIREGRRTLLMNNGFTLANKSQKQALDKIVGNPRATYANLRIVQDILKASGALENAEMTMLRHCDEARNILLRASFPMTFSNYLNDLLAFSIRRVR